MQKGQICKNVLLDDYITISEMVGKGQESWIQQVVDDRSGIGKGDRFQLHERKYKELRISFDRNELDFDPINFQTVRTANSENCSELLSVRNVKLKDARVVMHGYSS